MATEKTINLFAEFGVSDEQAHEINMEIHAIRDNSEYLTEILSAIPETYDRESILLGVFLAEIILRDSGRLLPSDMKGATIVTLPRSSKEMLDELLNGIESNLGESEISPFGDPEDN